MTERDSDEDGCSDVRLSRRRVLQLLGGTAVGGAFSGEAVSAAGAQSESEDDELVLEDDESMDVAGISDERISGPTQVIEGATETYRVNRSDDLDIGWSASNGTVNGDGPSVDVTFGSPGEATVSVFVAEDGTITGRGELEVSVAARPHVFVDGPDTVLFGDVSAYEARSDPADATISWRGWAIEPGAAGEITDEGDTASVGFHPEDDNEVTVAVEYEIATGEVLRSSRDVDVRSRHLGIDCLAEFGIDCSDEVAVGQEYAFEVTGITDGLVFENWSITPSHAGKVLEDAGDTAEITFENEASPATIEVEYETESGYRGSLEHEIDVKQIELWFEDARLVQTVENTRVEDTNGNVLWDGEPDPDFVAGRNASIGFNLDGKHVDLLKNDVTVVVEREIVDVGSSRFISRLGDNSVIYDDEFELQVTDERNDVENFVDAEYGIDELHKLANRHGVDVPVFSLDAGYNTRRELSSVEIRIESDVVESDPVRIDKGDDFSVSNPRTLRVGFIALKDPDDGDNYGEINDGYPFDRDNWHEQYLDAVDEAVEMTKKVYPVDEIEVYAHEKLMNGAIGILDDALDDGVEAQDVVEEEFPEFDATILVVPRGYFEYHRDDDSRGLHFGPKAHLSKQPAAADVVRDEFMDEWTPAHEMIHTFTRKPYEGPANAEPDEHPMAQREGWEEIDDGGWYLKLDYEHARGTSDTVDGEFTGVGVRSTKFDLADGTYEAKREDVQSIMSYDRGESWADARFFQELIDEGFDPTPPESSSWWATSSGSTSDERIEVLSGIATIEDDGTATIRYMRPREGTPMPSDGDGNVTLTLQSADGETLGTATTADEWVGLAEESTQITDTVPFVLPYPQDIEAIVFEREGTTSTIDPRGGLLASAKDRMAEESFIKKPEDRLPSLQDKLESVDGQLQNRAYKAAYNKLTNDIRPRVVEWLHTDADVPANYYTKSELLALLDDVIARLDALYDVHDNHECGPPDDHPGQGPPEDHPGRGHPEDHPGRGPPEDTPGRGPPDEPLGCDPSDDEPGRGPPDDDDDPGRGPPDDGDDDNPGRGPPGDGDDDDDDPPGNGPPGDDGDDDDDDPPGNGPPGDDPPGSGPPDDDDDRGNRATVREPAQPWTA